MDPSPSSPSGRPPGVPVVDASPIGLDKEREPAEEEMARFGTGFARALEECGFVVVVGHGVRVGSISLYLEAGLYTVFRQIHEKKLFWPKPWYAILKNIKVLFLERLLFFAIFFIL